MQFGRLYGTSLIILGIILCFLQFTRYMAPNKDAGPTQSESRTATNTEHRTSPLPAIVGVGSLLAGIALFVTARRKDEPAPQHQVK
jgi:hypothetical protein